MTVQRITPDTDKGLTTEQVQLRVKAKATNRVQKVVGKSYLQIFTSNVFTYFNLLGIILAVLMLLCGSPENMMFIVIFIANMALGIIQEIRSKVAVERLAVVTEPTATVIRNGVEQQVDTKDVVLDDVTKLTSGNQVFADCVIMQGCVEVNESMLTGESVAVKKCVGDTLLSGSFVVSGSCLALCDKVGKDSYVEQMSATVKRSKAPNSELMRSIRLIIKTISFAIFPLGIATFLTSNEMRTFFAEGTNVIAELVAGNPTVTQGVKTALKATSGLMCGMIPCGMMLLTTLALAVGALKLALKKVLVRELPCIEMLARVDTLCMDKTGTITDGTMTVTQVVELDGNIDLASAVTSLLNATKDANATALALSNYFHGNVQEVTNCVPFSSERKYSGAVVNGIGNVVMGANEFLFPGNTQLAEQCNKYLAEGLRVITVGIADDITNVTNARPVAIVVLQDTVRSDAREIISWFKNNDVDVKIISGDNPLAVSVIASKVGVDNAEKYISIENMTDEQVAEVATKYTVFGRVSPEQKAILVRALKANGKTVAMTGDGVNDILAMRESDCAISVGCGTDAAKTVSHLVLSDNKFGSLPKVVAEGRQVVNNVQNSSSLFIMKTTLVVLTALLTLFLPYTYPFESQQMYAVEFFVIGLCSFALALKPNHNIIRGHFISNTLKRALPSGIAMFVAVASVYVFLPLLNFTDTTVIAPFTDTTVTATVAMQISSTAMFAMTCTGVVALCVLLYPHDLYNLAVCMAGIIGTVVTFIVFPWALKLVHDVISPDKPFNPMYVPLNGNAVTLVVLTVVLTTAIIITGRIITDKITNKEKTL